MTKMVVKLSLLQVVVSLTICVCCTDDANTALEDGNQVTREKELLQWTSSKFTLDESTVLHFPIYRDGGIKYINIAEEISNDQSEDFGTKLLGMERLSDIDSIIKKNPQNANVRIISKWFDGLTENPRTCGFLVEVLYKIRGFSDDLVNEIKTTCKHFNVLDEPYKPRVLKRYSQQLSEKYKKEPVIETNLFLPNKLRERMISYVDLEMKEKGGNVSLPELFDNIQIGMRVLFLGRPGVGKTTVTRHITKMLISNGGKHPCKYLVVKVHLGMVKEIDSLETLLSVGADESFKPDDIKRISEFIKRTVGEGVCFLLDGLDEYRARSSYIYDLLKGDYLKKSVVVSTSRPSAADSIKDDFHRKVEIIGFGTAGVQTYLEQLQLPDAKYQTINQYLSTHPNVRQLCHLPLHLSMLVYVAVVTEDDGTEGDDVLSVADTETQLYFDFLSLTIRQYQEVRHEQTPKSLKGCSDDIYKKTDLCIIFQKIYQASFEGLMSSPRKSALTSSSFTGLPDCSNISARIEDLSLFKVVHVDDRRGVGLYKYYYSHPTFQEFFAAFHLTTLPRDEQLKYIRYHWMHEVYKFFLGLIGKELSLKYDSGYLSQTFVSFAMEIMSTYQRQELYIMKCSHETGQSSNFVPFLQAAGVIAESNSLNVYTFHNHDCWYIGYTLLQSSFYKLSVDKHSELGLCISFITNYLKHEPRILDRVNVEKLALGSYSNGYWSGFTEKGNNASVKILMNFLPVFKKYLKHLELTFMKFEDNESVLRLGDTLESFEKLSFLALSVNVNVIKDGSLEIALKKLPFLNHLELGVINRHDDNTSIPGNVLEFKSLTKLKSLTLFLSWNKDLVNVNMTSLIGGLEYVTNLQSLSVRITLYSGFRVYGATEMLQGMKRLSISELALHLDLCWENGLGNVSVKELATVLNDMTTLRDLSLCVDFISSGISGNTGVTELNIGLKSLANLQRLHLDLRWELQMDESIDKGAVAIANALKQLDRLKVLELNLSHNGSVSKIASLFQFLPQLQELQLKWRNFHDKTEVSKLINGIKHLKQLKKLDLSWNEIGDEDVISLVDALKYFNDFSTLDLSHNKIGDTGLKLLAQLIESEYLSSLQELLLSQNVFGDTGAEILSQKVVKLTKLRTLDLGLKQGKYSAHAMTQIYKLQKSKQKPQMKMYNESYIPSILDDIRKVAAFVPNDIVVAFVLGGIIVIGFVLGGMVLVLGGMGKYASQNKDVFQLVKSSDALDALTIFSASSAWKLRRSGHDLDGRGTVIAILDSDIDRQYSAFNGKSITTINCLPPEINSGLHGTLCAAVAIGSRVLIPPTTFIPEGVAPRATCIVYRVADDNHFSIEAVLRALDAIELRIRNKTTPVDVVSISYDIFKSHDQIKQKIFKLAENRVVFVAAAGNSADYQPRASFPARLDSVICVGALDRYGRPSQFNPPVRIDVFAPGEDIPFAGSTYWGTSFATPAIGGLVLLLKQHAKEVGFPACDHIHRVEILRKIFAEDMVVTSDNGEKLFAPEEFLERITSRRHELNDIVRKHLDTLESVGSMETD